MHISNTKNAARRFAIIAALLIIQVVLSPLTLAAQQELTVESTVTDTACLDTIPWPQSMQMRLDSIIGNAGMLNTSQMGFMVYDLTADSVLYTRDHRQTLRPASTMKLITAITALDKLGSSYEYSTRLCYTGEVVPSTNYECDSTSLLTGDVYCIGGMDPMISRDDLAAFARSLREMGIDTICGSIYADRSMKEEDPYGEGWCWDGDNAILSPLVYERKDNMLQNFVKALAVEGICVNGSVGEAKACPRGARTVSELKRPLKEVLLPMLKNSNNLYAESMFYQIGLTGGRPATAKKAKAVEEAVLKKAGLGDAIHRFADGSGLSLYNYVSAEIEVAFLRYAYSNNSIFEALYPALPIAAVDGTISKRMADTPAAGNVHAKTGTLSGVSSLAGYLTAPNGHLLCFAIINTGVMKGIYAKNLQDSLCAAMCK